MRIITTLFIVFILSFFLWTIFLNSILINKQSLEDPDDVTKESERLTEFENEKFTEKDTPQVHNKWNDPIPVLVFSCNRASAVREHLRKLLKYRPNKRDFPIIVSQDCDNNEVKNEVLKFGRNVKYIKHNQANINVPSNHRKFMTYYQIARHYKLALDYVFHIRNYTSVIITEDDLDISPDFFSFFSSTRYLLENDPKLWCVSAWNDNGKPDNIDINDVSKLYRSDFFPGLGWMMTSKLWQEIGPIWPPGFWDDWMREPSRRMNRQCIRPEVSRTGMTNFGKNGASEGLFFNEHLSKIRVNREMVDFSKLDLDYLLEENYPKFFNNEVYNNSELIDIENLESFLSFAENEGKKIRIIYKDARDFTKKAGKLQLMTDSKAGVPRTAYDGIVTCYFKGLRIYLIPDRTKIVGYDPN